MTTPSATLRPVPNQSTSVAPQELTFNNFPAEPVAGDYHGARLTPQSFPPGHPTPFTQRQMELLTEAQAAALQGQSDLAASMLQQLIG